jgi:hypothetical protein
MSPHDATRPADGGGPEESRLAAEALRTLRAHRAGTLLCDGQPEPVRFILDGRDGSLVLPIAPPLLDAGELLLCLPDDSFDTTMRALVLPTGAEPDEEARDRYLAYHGRASEAAWVRARPEFVKLSGGRVVDGERVVVPNALRGEEPALCRTLNADRDALRRVVGLLAKVEPDEPLAVGVDPDGFDVRARFGIVRVEFPAPVPNGAEAERVIRTLLRECA